MFLKAMLSNASTSKSRFVSTLSPSVRYLLRTYNVEVVVYDSYIHFVHSTMKII